MTRANTAATSRGKKFGSGTVGGWGATAMFAVVMCGAGVLSGCAGLATPSNASPTPQEAVHISPSSISFAAVAVGQKATQTATLTNTGSEPVMITQLALSSTEFSASGLATPLSIGPGQSAKFQVTYTGTTSGDSSGTLTAMTSHGSGSSKVKLRGSSGKTGIQRKWPDRADNHTRGASGGAPGEVRASGARLVNGSDHGYQRCHESDVHRVIERNSSYSDVHHVTFTGKRELRQRELRKQRNAERAAL